MRVHSKVMMYLWWSLCTLYLHRPIIVSKQNPSSMFYVCVLFMPVHTKVMMYLWGSLCTLYLHRPITASTENPSSVF